MQAAREINDNRSPWMFRLLRQKLLEMNQGAPSSPPDDETTRPEGFNLKALMQRRRGVPEPIDPRALTPPFNPSAPDYRETLDANTPPVLPQMRSTLMPEGEMPAQTDTEPSPWWSKMRAEALTSADNLNSSVSLPQGGPVAQTPPEKPPYRIQLDEQQQRGTPPVLRRFDPQGGRAAVAPSDTPPVSVRDGMQGIVTQQGGMPAGQAAAPASNPLASRLTAAQSTYADRSSTQGSPSAMPTGTVDLGGGSRYNQFDDTQTRERVVDLIGHLDNQIAYEEQHPEANHNGRLKSALLSSIFLGLKGLATGGIGGGIGGALAGLGIGALRPQTDELLKQEWRTNQLKSQRDSAAARRKDTLDAQGKVAETNYKQAATDWYRQRPDIEAQKIAEKRRADDARALASILNHTDDFDPDNPDNADVVSVAESLNIPRQLLRKRPDQRIDIKQDALSGEFRVIVTNKKTGASSASPVVDTQTEKPAALTPPSRVTADTADKNRLSREQIAAANRASRESIAKSRQSGDPRVRQAAVEIQKLNRVWGQWQRATTGAASDSYLQQMNAMKEQIKQRFPDLIEEGDKYDPPLRLKAPTSRASSAAPQTKQQANPYEGMVMPRDKVPEWAKEHGMNTAQALATLKAHKVIIQ